MAERLRTLDCEQIYGFEFLRTRVRFHEVAKINRKKSSNRIKEKVERGQGSAW